MSTKVKKVRTKEARAWHPAAVLGVSGAAILLFVVLFMWLSALPLNSMPDVLQAAIIVFALVGGSVAVVCLCVFIFTLMFRSNRKEWKLK